MIQSFGTHPTPTRSASTGDRQPTKSAMTRDSLVQVLDYLMEKATPRDERAVADYLVGYSVQQAEGVYHLVDGELVWQSPTDENVHIVISVRDAIDGRFLPSLNIHATLLDTNGNVVDMRRQPFVWHPWLYDYGYGCNWKIPADGQYTLRIHIEPPSDSRRSPVTIDFKNVKIVIQKKTH